MMEPIQLPAELMPVLVYLLTAGIKDILKIFGHDVNGKISALIAAIVTALVASFQTFLNALPDTAKPVIQASVALVQTLLVAYGVKRTLRNLRPE